MDLGLRGRAVIVTGGSSGIGHATVRLLLEEGAQVATCGRRAESLAEAWSKEAAAGCLLFRTCDVRDEEAVGAFVEAAAERFGRIDGLVANAGYGTAGTLSTTTSQMWLDEMRMKVFGAVLPLRSALPWLRRSDSAGVVLIGGASANRPTLR